MFGSGGGHAAAVCLGHSPHVEVTDPFSVPLSH